DVQAVLVQNQASGTSLRVSHERDAVIPGIEAAVEESLVLIWKQLEPVCARPLLEEMIALAGDREHQVWKNLRIRSVKSDIAVEPLRIDSRGTLPSRRCVLCNGLPGRSAGRDGQRTDRDERN